MTATTKTTTTTSRGRFQAHVHPETYSVSDPLHVRANQLHTKAAHCELSMCTFSDHTPAAQDQLVEAARMLRKAIAADKREAKRIDSEHAEVQALTAARKATGRKLTQEEAAQVTGKTEKPREARPNSERRNELPHADAAAAVGFKGCPSCKARKGKRCVARNGSETNHVHAGRLAAWDAS